MVWNSSRFVEFVSNGLKAKTQLPEKCYPSSCVFVMNLNTNTDVLVAPLRPVQRLHELSSAEVADLFQTVQKVEAVMGRVHNTSSTTVSVQDGPLAGQTIQVTTVQRYFIVTKGAESEGLGFFP